MGFLRVNIQFAAYVQLFLAMAIVGSSVVAGKILTESLPVMLASTLRFAIASCVLMIFLFIKEKKISLPSKKELTILFFQTLTGVFFFSVFLLYGLKHTGAIEAGLITGTLPAVIATLAFFVLKDKLKLKQILGILITVFGSILLNIFGGEISSGPRFSLLGGSLVFGAVICEALFTILGKMLSKRLSPLMIATMVSLLGFLLFLPFGVWEGYHFDFSKTSLSDWSLVLYFAIVVTVGAFWLFYSGLSHVSASMAGAFMAFIPLSAVLLSACVLHEPIQSIHLIAGSCVIGGILLLK